MKELHSESNGWTMAILDEDNYVVFDKRKPIYIKDKEGEYTFNEDGSKKVRYKHKYFNAVQHCVKELSRLVSNETANDLREWIENYKELVTRIEKLCN